MTIEELSFDDRSVAADLWAEVDLTRPWNDPAADFDRALAGPTSTVLGLRREGKLIGTAMVGHDGHRGWVYYLAVSPAHQRRGLGAELISAAEDWLRSVGAVKVQLMVRHTNHRTKSFYAGLGYEDADVSVLARWLS
jgi:ribosomal protein S18 acetylase RimI-like enzyme